MTNETPSSSIDAVGSSLGAKAMEGGTVTTALGWLTSNNVIALLGLGVAVLGFIVNLYFQYRRDRREHEFQVAKLAAMKRQYHGVDSEETPGLK